MTENTETTESQTTRVRGGLFSLLVDRPVFALMITVAMVLVGVMSLFRLPLTFMGDGMTW